MVSLPMVSNKFRVNNNGQFTNGEWVAIVSIRAAFTVRTLVALHTGCPIILARTVVIVYLNRQRKDYGTPCKFKCVFTENVQDSAFPSQPRPTGCSKSFALSSEVFTRFNIYLNYVLKFQLSILTCGCEPHYYLRLTTLDNEADYTLAFFRLFL